jgi:ATP-binding cassette, subfamily B, bacterial
MHDSGHGEAGLRETIRCILWTFATARSTSPGLFAAFWLNALIGAVFPAGVALSVRGLVNVVSDGLAGTSGFQPEAIYLWLLVGFAMTFGMVVTGSVSTYLGRRFETELSYRLPLDILRHAQTMAFARFENPQFRDALTRAQQDPAAKVAQTLAFTLDLLTKGIQVLSLLAILFVIEPTLFVLLLPIGIPYLVFQWRLSRRQFAEMDSRIEKQRWIDYYTVTLGSDDQGAEIKLLKLGPLLIERCRLLLAEFCNLLRSYQRAAFLGNLTFALLSVVAVYIAMGRAAFSIIDGRHTIGDLAIYGSAATQLRSLVESSIAVVARLRLQLLHVGNVLDFLEQEPEPARRATSRRVALVGRIEFRDVTFAYPGATKATLSSLSFSIAPGETVALVGDNGAGKTTVAKLIAGLYDPTGGTILFDGVDIRELDTDDLRRQVGCLFQHFGRYAATAADNIAFGDWERLLDDGPRIEAVARSAGVHDLIQSMPQGYGTLLGRSFGQYQPSGGEWQQVATARAMAREARILILDEPTANLDIDTEYRIFLRFRALAEGRTVLLISHRFSTVRMANRILVLEAGQLIENGSHEALMKLGGRYATLYDLHRRHLIAT